MRLVVAVVGKARNAALGEAIRDYETRAARYWPLDVHEVREERATGIPVDKVKERESVRLSEKVPERAQTVACELGGKSLSSQQFAELLQSAREQDRDLAFLIGGAFGLSPSVARKSTMRLSLAPWTLPHEIARLVLVEQIYRAGTIVRGEPYHK
ncbi:MAG TPA: 23S rRNA (pseudouridine(1915)-N(3))-methyltransferase RlmH [Gemmatimonadaceae bacterium]|jgi:23S rRNA (pseudouridine1915-N3)-methyltransferase|nr:23S rRNA (pseudouridine(1915)-N(3))-methyltransferase RlmH [Gemmatimonadaceae bacterium]